MCFKSSIQPAIKVRGRNCLHIIYGIDYLQPENLIRLKQGNVSRKQRHALIEFALGIEGGVLATLSLEAEPVAPRL
ncbi:hypothetical protein [Desulfosporosinus sp. Sb-LF]|uniref:hypothetical protein n=1 Tax=Desulfosporosinus sp. Sb-LF TaxID=2560027 RepID=UPI00107F1AE0|nr:hypothetical protein [Desulfosporosinus sp. Sb-LF]TGE33563.1 hypothetical protein E4K68_05290 [Desulfosporosinus sp. Sb-LF]